MASTGITGRGSSAVLASSFNSRSCHTSSSQVDPLVSSFQAHQFYLDCLFVPIITSFVLLSLFLFPTAQSLRTFTVSKICATSTTTNSSNQGSSSMGTSVQCHTACSFLHVWIISDFCFFSLLNVANVAFLHSAISPNRQPPNFPSLHAAKTRVFSATTHQPFWNTQNGLQNGVPALYCENSHPASLSRNTNCVFTNEREARNSILFLQFDICSRCLRITVDSAQRDLLYIIFQTASMYVQFILVSDCIALRAERPIFASFKKTSSGNG